MNAARIKSMRDKANALEIGHWPEASMLMLEAASELERLGKIEAAANEVLSATISGTTELMGEKIVAMNRCLLGELWTK